MITTYSFINEELSLSLMEYDILKKKLDLKLKCQDCESFYRNIGNEVFYDLNDFNDFFTSYKVRGNAVFYIDNYYFLTSNTFSDKNSD